jgi:conjugal transfer/entry exclusion protein
MQRIQIPPNITIDRLGHRKVVFATKEAKATLRLWGLRREERMVALALRKETQQTDGDIGIEVEKIEDAMRLGVLLLAALATEENAQLERMSSTQFDKEAQGSTARRKQETEEALRTSVIGFLSPSNTTAKVSL